jgi:translocation and assembly module TamA
VPTIRDALPPTLTLPLEGGGKMSAIRALTLAVLLAALAIRPAFADAPYTVDIALDGKSDKTLLEALNSASQLVALKDHPPASAAALRRRAEEDLPRLQAAMNAEGYWRAEISYRLDTKAQPEKLAVKVTRGPLYHLATVAFVLPSGAPAPLPKRPAEVGLALGGPALSAPVEAANARIVSLYAQNGQPFARVTDRKVVVDLATATMSARYTIEPGATARFGATAITGLHGVAADFVKHRIAWTEGKDYDERLVERTRQDLVRSALFSAVLINHADAPAADGTVAMTLDLVEGPPHSIGVGAGYNTNIGLGARTFWEDRDLFGNGEDLRLSAGAAQRQIGVAANFRRPDFLVQKQDLVTDAELLKEKTDAYASRRARAYVGVEELMFPPYTLGGGVSLERTYLTQTSRDENYLLLGVPLYVRRDSTDDLLDPTTGTRTTATATPYHGLDNTDLDFLSMRFEERAYIRIGDSAKYVFAFYGALGSVVGASLEDLPADKRLYAGGAGSVRGYGYQRAGPLDSSEVPIGGRSSAELGGEFRWRITDTIGIVPFLDAGTVFPTILPSNPNLFYSPGLGLRYYTAIGPIRLDVAFPLEKRSSDSAFQFYISLGQAF